MPKLEFSRLVAAEVSRQMQFSQRVNAFYQR
jgi:hypothetical protein